MKKAAHLSERPLGFASIKWTLELSPHCPLLELRWAMARKIINTVEITPRPGKF
jgi:hypothetical protein